VAEVNRSCGTSLSFMGSTIQEPINSRNNYFERGRRKRREVAIRDDWWLLATNERDVVERGTAKSGPATSVTSGRSTLWTLWTFALVGRYLGFERTASHEWR
jgi:hypothetical protein